MPVSYISLIDEPEDGRPKTETLPAKIRASAHLLLFT